MLSETAKPTTQFQSDDGDKQKNFDREVRDMVNTLTSRIAGGSQQQHTSADDEHGVRIITLAGNNTGATMRSQLDEKGKTPQEGVSLGDQGSDEALGTFVNSNFQAVNNSIMFGSTYNTNDPGVHLEISDLIDQQHGHVKHGKKGKKSFKSDHQQSAGHSD